MTTEEPAGPPASTVQRGLALLEEAPWDELHRSVTLLLVRPPLAEWLDEAHASDLPPAFWLLVDHADARTLPEPWLSPLMRDAMRRVRDRDAELVVLTSEGCAALLDTATRRAFEARWILRHAQPLHDPRARHESITQAATRLPVEALERAARALYLQTFAALDALPLAVDDAFIAAGEAAGAVARLACLLEEGSYPPPEWVLPAARATQRNRWLRPWLDSLTGDKAALRAAALAAPDVLRELTAALRTHFAGRPWLQDPERYTLRTPRGPSGG